MTESHADQASPATDGAGPQFTAPAAPAAPAPPAAPEQPYPSDGPIPPAAEEEASGPVPEQEPAGEDREETPGPSGEPARPAALGVERRPTGHAEVDTGLARLADADDLPVHAHLEVYEDVHRELRDTLTALDTRTGPPVPGPAR